MLSIRNCTGIFLRTYKTRVTDKLNSGISRRLKLMQEKQLDLTINKIDEQSLDNLERDVKSSTHLQDYHKSEINKLKKKILFKQIERKYFSKQKLPNMLLWAEKEQIRLLSQTNPDVWTPEKLATSFPATPDIIRKVLRSQWKPESGDRIVSHDKAVSSNWKALEAGSLPIPHYYAKHLKLFTTRRELTFKPKDKSIVAVEQTEGGEFSNIIRDYKKSRNTESFKGKQETSILNSLEENSVEFEGNQKRRNFRGGKEYTLKELKKFVDLKELESADLHQLLINSDEQDTFSNFGALNEDYVYSVDDHEAGIIEITCTDSEHNSNLEEILLKVEIPKDKWKKGCTYKINNCYYSDDGEFLYST